MNDNNPSVQIMFENGSTFTYIDDVSIGYTGITPSFVEGYNAKPIAGQATATSAVNTNITSNSTYYYRLRAVGANGTSDNSNVITVTTGTNKVTTETGEWNTLVWNPAGTPTQIDDVTINHTVTLAGNADCHNLSIGTGTLTVQSGGSIIPRGTVTGSVTLERQIGAWGNAVQGWHLVSSPVSNQLLSNGGWITSPATSYDFYGYNEALYTEYWRNQKISGNGITSFVPGKGYLVAYLTGSTKTFSGALNTTDVVNIPLTYTAASSAQNAGWNLLGNPFASGLTWGTWAYGNDNTNIISASAKLLSSIDASYDDISVGEVIPALNGFFVETNANTTLTIPTSARTHGGTWYKNSESVSKLTLTARDLDGETAQRSHVRILPEATTGYDRLYDSKFIAFYAPQFYSVSGDLNLSTNAIPEVTEATIIDFGFIKNDGNNFRIEATGLESVSATPYLTDRKTGIVTNLRQTPEYSFTASDGDNVNRFTLHFGTLGIENPSAELVNIYAHSGIIYMNNVAAKAEITVTNLLGQVVQQARATGNGTTTLNAQSLPKGVYVVSVISNGQTLSRKVVL